MHLSFVSTVRVCSQASKDHLVVKKGEQGKLCGTTGSLNPLSSCKGSGLKDDIEVSGIPVFLCFSCLFVIISFPQPDLVLKFKGGGLKDDIEMRICEII